jgi:glycosyltransferase involved in cell wall biosynthesis
MKEKPDLVYSPGFSPAVLSPVPQVVTVHDLIGRAFPANQGSISRLYWTHWQPFALKQARCLVASSESTRRDIQRYLNIREDRVCVVPLAAHPAFHRLENPEEEAEPVLQKYNLRTPFFLSVSTLEPRKNFLRLLQAYENLRQKGKNFFSLVIVGKPGGAQKILAEYVREKKLEREVKFLGYLESDELVRLYNAALGYVMISLYEGFGLPVLEAMSCGLSGICSNRSSLPEVAGDTALMVDPENVNEIAEAMSVFWEDSVCRNKLAQAAWQRAGLFSMTRCAEQMMGIFRNEAQK